MATYIIRRVLQAIPILFGVSLISFAIVQLAPGSPIDRFRAPNVRPETLENLIRLYGLDKPVWEQYVSWITAFVQVWNVDCLGLQPRRRPVRARYGRRPHARHAPPRRHRAPRHGHRRRPDRDPRRGQAVQLGRQGHHDLRHHRLRHPVIPARPVHRLSRHRRVPRPLPRLRHGQPARRRGPWHAARRGLAHGAAGDLARDSADRGLVPLRASQDARGPAPGLRAHGQGQGPELGEGHLQARPAQRAHPGHHPVRPDAARTAGRRRHHRDDLQLAGPRAARRSRPWTPATTRRCWHS